jgi:hypothetical protein
MNIHTLEVTFDCGDGDPRDPQSQVSLDILTVAVDGVMVNQRQEYDQMFQRCQREAIHRLHDTMPKV